MHVLSFYWLTDVFSGLEQVPSGNPGSGFSCGASNFYSVSLGRSPDKQTHLLRQVGTNPGQVKFESCLPSEQAENIRTTVKTHE